MRQLGSRENTSCLEAVTLLKEIVHKYSTEGSTAYSCFLDISKAFERVNHGLLLEKRRLKCLSTHTIGLLEFFLSNSCISVKYANATSRSWEALRGFRQGGVLSAHLLIIYIDEMISLVSREESGCLLSLKKVNIQAYAYDIILSCPTADGLIKLMKIFHGSRQLHDLKNNLEKKTVKYRNRIPLVLC